MWDPEATQTADAVRIVALTGDDAKSGQGGELGRLWFHTTMQKCEQNRFGVPTPHL